MDCRLDGDRRQCRMFWSIGVAIGIEIAAAAGWYGPHPDPPEIQS
jgi:hypothetical protein